MSALATALGRPQTYVGYAREAMSLATCVARYPLGFTDTGCRSGSPCGDALRDTPVLLVHGFGHNRSGWYVLDRHLRQRGFTSVHGHNYVPFPGGIPAMAERLAGRIERVCRITGAEQVNVVGHSLGGLILRWYIQELGGDERVRQAVTVATPHDGTASALFPLALGLDIRPRSSVIRQLRATARPTDVEWTAYYSNLDLVVHPAASAMLRHPVLPATNILVKDRGHLSIMLSVGLARSIADRLLTPAHAMQVPAGGSLGAPAGAPDGDDSRAA